MPYKSDQQRKYFHWAEKVGKIKPTVVNEFDNASKGIALPKKIKFKKLSKYLKGEK